MNTHWFPGRWLWTIPLVTFVVMLCLVLGFWQLRRLEERRAHNAEIKSRMEQPILQLSGQAVDPEALNFRRVVVEGVYDPGQEVVLRYRSYRGATGVHLITPLLLSGSQVAVLVDRGWIPYTEAAPEARARYTVSGVVTVQGLAREPQRSSAGSVPADPPPGSEDQRVDTWTRIDIAGIQRQIPYSLLPIFIEQAPGPDPNQLPASSYDVDLDEGPHLGYAIQWFSFAIILLVGYASLVFRHHAAATAFSVR